MTSEFIINRLAETGLYALQLFAQLAFLFVAISILVGALQEWLPAEKTRHYLAARRGRGYLIGALIGAGTPFCSCSTVPLTLGLLKSGAGFGPTMTLLFTSPLVNPIIVTLFWITFGIELTLLYTGMALAMAISMSWLMERANFARFVKRDLLEEKPQAVSVSVPLTTLHVKEKQPCCTTSGGSEPVTLSLDVPDTCATPEKSMPNPHLVRAKRLFNEAVAQFRSFLPHVVIGVLIGAFAHGFVPDAWLVEYAGNDNLWAIPLAAIIGVPLYVRGSTMIPIAMTLTAKGMGIGAVIALVIGGAGASLPEVVMLQRMFRWQILLAFLFSVFSIAIITGFLAQAFF